MPYPDRVEAALTALIALQIQEKSDQMSDPITFDYAVKCASKKIDEAHIILTKGE